MTAFAFWRGETVSECGTLPATESIVLNKHYEEDGAIVFREACRLGCEGIVSKKLGSIYRRGRSPLWLKVKNPNAPAVKREAEEDWGSPHWITVKSARPQP
jgi:ATP-dependent DNA ligase